MIVWARPRWFSSTSRRAPADGAARPSSDTPTHLVLYRSFERLGGIVHTHSPSASAWAQARRDLPCLGTTHADHFHGPVPCTRELTQDEIEGDYEARTGDVIVETIEARGSTRSRCRPRSSRRTGPSPGASTPPRRPKTRSRSRPSPKPRSGHLHCGPTQSRSGNPPRPALPAQARTDRVLRSAYVNALRLHGPVTSAYTRSQRRARRR